MHSFVCFTNKSLSTSPPDFIVLYLYALYIFLRHLNDAALHSLHKGVSM